MNYGQMIQGVRDRLGIPTGDGYLTEARIGGYINDGLQAYSLEEDWPWLQATGSPISTVSGTESYATPTDWMSSVDLRHTDTGEGLAEGQYGDLQDRSYPTLYNRPREWAVWGDRIMLSPIPDGVYSIAHRYIKMEPVLAGDTDTPILPAPFHTGLVEFATTLGLRQVHEEWRGYASSEAYNSWLGRMVKNRRRYSGPLRIKVRPGLPGASGGTW